MNSVRDYTGKNVGPQSEAAPVADAHASSSETVPGFSARDGVRVLPQQGGLQRLPLQGSLAQPDQPRRQGRRVRGIAGPPLRGRRPGSSQISGFRRSGRAEPLLHRRPDGDQEPELPRVPRHARHRPPSAMLAVYGPNNGFGWKTEPGGRRPDRLRAGGAGAAAGHGRTRSSWCCCSSRVFGLLILRSTCCCGGR